MKYLSDMYKGFMSGVGNLFSGAKHYVTTKVSEGVAHVKKEIGKSVVAAFGPAVIDAGKTMVSNKIDEVLQEYTPSRVLKGLFGDQEPNQATTTASDENPSMSEHFGSLLDSAEEGLEDFLEDTDATSSPLKKSAATLASKLLKKGRAFQSQLASLSEKTAQNFKKEIERAIPTLERDLTSTFVAMFIVPILNFITSFLKSFFNINEPRHDNNASRADEADDTQTSNPDVDASIRL